MESLARVYASVSSNVPEPPKTGSSTYTQPGIIGDLHDANLNVVQGLHGRATAVVTVGPSAVWLIQGR